MSGILNSFIGGSYGSPPGAPTIGTATATAYNTATVAFTAPSCTGGLSITGYQAVCVATGTKTGTGSSSPITVTGLSGSTSYTFKVRAQNAIGYGSYSGNSNSITTPVQPNSQSFTTAGTFCWTAPAGVTSVSVVAIGGGSTGGGGGLGTKNNYTVTPGNNYLVVVGKGNCPGSSFPLSGSVSYFVSTATVAGYSGQGHPSHNGTGGGCGGNSGAAGYSGGGADIGSAAPSGGGGGGGGNLVCDQNRWQHCGCVMGYGAGGGTGLFGQGSSGSFVGNSAVGSSLTGSALGGIGGSGGGTGANTTFNYSTSTVNAGAGGLYGGSTGIICVNFTTLNYARGAVGAVRIVWPGSTRSFPSTCVGSP